MTDHHYFLKNSFHSKTLWEPDVWGRSRWECCLSTLLHSHQIPQGHEAQPTYQQNLSGRTSLLACHCSCTVAFLSAAGAGRSFLDPPWLPGAHSCTFAGFWRLVFGPPVASGASLLDFRGFLSQSPEYWPLHTAGPPIAGRTEDPVWNKICVPWDTSTPQLFRVTGGGTKTTVVPDRRNSIGPSSSHWLFGLVAWFSLRVGEVLGSTPRTALCVTLI